MMAYLANLDLGLLHLVNGWSGIGQLDRAVGFAAANGFFKGAIFIAAYWWFWFLPGSRGPRRAQIISALTATIIALVVARLLALELPFRTRPLYNENIGFHLPTVSTTSQDLGFENWSSFPSDHAAMFFALACGLWRLSRPTGMAAFLFTIVWVCAPRVYLGIHYPSDLAAGGAIGVLAVCIVSCLNFDRITAAVLRMEAKHPQAFYAVMFLTSYEIAALFVDIREFMHGSLSVLKTLGFSMLNLAEGCAAAVGIAVLLIMTGKYLLRTFARFRSAMRFTRWTN